MDIGHPAATRSIGGIMTRFFLIGMALLSLSCAARSQELDVSIAEATQVTEPAVFK